MEVILEKLKHKCGKAKKTQSSQKNEKILLNGYVKFKFPSDIQASVFSMSKIVKNIEIFQLAGFLFISQLFVNFKILDKHYLQNSTACV